MKTIRTALLTLALVLTPAVVLADSGIRIYVREGCSHCANVKAFIETNELEDTGDITIIETYNNEANQTEMDVQSERVGVPTESRGSVPFMVYGDGTDYEIGDTPIIAYLADHYEITDLSTGSEYSAGTTDYVFLGLGGVFVLGILGYGIYTVFVSKDD